MTCCRTNLGNARVLNNTAPDNFVAQLGLDGNKYNTVVAIFYARRVANIPRSFRMSS